jgi:Post-segregation antitoxin CcdA
MRSDANAMTNRGNVVLYLDKDLVQKSKELGFNLSKTVENHLKQLTNGYSPVSTQNIGNLEMKNDERWAEPDSDRRPLARKANVLTKLDDQPTFCCSVPESLSSRFTTFGYVVVTCSTTSTCL